jgi:2'-5' RNA ligase
MSTRYTLRNVRRDFHEWHLGRPHYALWALLLDTEAVGQRVQAAQKHLADRLLDGYCRQAHVTVALCGFPSAAPQHADDFGAQALCQQLAALRRSGSSSFEIGIGGLASFSSVPYLSVQEDAGHLGQLHSSLAGSGMHSAAENYIPHVTVGLYADAWPMSAVQAQLDSFAYSGRLRLTISRLCLLSYVAKDIGGPLQTLAEYDFQTGALQWQEVSDSLPECFREIG